VTFLHEARGLQLKIHIHLIVIYLFLICTSLELTYLHFIMKSYFDNRSKLLDLIVFFWEDWIKKKEELIRAARNQGLCVDL